MYKLSIIITSINSINELQNTFKSIINQSLNFEDIEVIFIDNFSNEDILSFIKNLSQKYSNVFYYKLDDNSHFSTKKKNLGITRSSASFVMFLDSGNILLSDAAETLINIISENNVDIVFGNYISIKDTEYISHNQPKLNLKKGFLETDSISENFNLLKMNFPLSTKIFRKDFLLNNKIEFQEDMMLADYIFESESFLKTEGIIFLNKPLIKIESEAEDNILYDMDYMMTYIDELENFYSFLKSHHEEYAWICLYKLEHWINLLLITFLSDEYKINLFEKSWFLISEYNKSRQLKTSKKIQLLFDLIDNKEYFKAIELIRLINSIEDFDYEKVLSKDVIFLFYGFDYDVGGLAKAVFNRANILADKGLNITLINTDPHITQFIGLNFKNINLIEDNYRKIGYINDKVKFFNAFEYYRKKNTCISKNHPNTNKLPDIPIYINDQYVIENIRNENGMKIYNFYYKNQFNKEELDLIRNIYKKPLSDKINQTQIDKLLNKRISKREYYINDILYMEDFFDENNNISEELLYTEDAFNFFKILKVNNKIQYRLYSSISASEIKFDKIGDFCDYFINEICLNCQEKAFLINDCSGPIPSFNNVPSDLAYKIANIHSNPFLKPTYCYGCKRRDMSALQDVKSLDALVCLTNSEKEDFKKEFVIDQIYEIPNIIDLNEIFELDKQNFNRDYNRISIFARISPEKNLADAIKALKLVVDKHPEVILNIYGRAYTVGEIKELKEIKKLIKKLNLEDNIKFKGHSNNPYNDMRTSLVTVLVSHIEGLPMVLIESMANSTPMITYDINYGPRDVITNNENGFIVEKYNYVELANKIIYLLENPHIAETMGIKAQQYIFENFSPDVIYHKWLNVLKNAYINSNIREIETFSNHCKYKNEFHEKTRLIKIKTNLIEEKKDILRGYKLQKQKIKKNTNSNKKKIKQQSNIIKNQKRKIKNQNDKLKKLSNSHNKVKQEKNNIIKNNRIKRQKDKDNIAHLKTTIDYYKLKSKFKKKLLLPLPYVYIIYKHKNVLENIKLYRLLQNNDWFDIGFYLDKYGDISRNKWCKFLTPELHYVCHGFDEKRLPYPNYKKNLTKKEIIKKISDKNV